MFEAAEVGHKVPKSVYKEREPRVREALLKVQRRLAVSRLAAVIVVGGVEGAGKEETVDLLMEWMDARGMEVHARPDVTDEERERPRFWPFWRDLPPAGKAAVFFGSWYTDPIVERTYERIGRAEFEHELSRVVEFERMLTQEGVVLVKFWMHLAKDVQKKNLKALKQDPDNAWRVTEQTWKYFKKYDAFRRVSEEALRHTSRAFAPWHIVEAADERYRNLTVCETIIETLGRALDEAAASKGKKPEKPAPIVPDPYNVIRSLDLSKTLSKEKYKKELARHERKLAILTRRLHRAKRSMICVFEGPDAAGKGGAIRRLTQPMDARNYRVISVAAPTDEEAVRPYLWRFWRHLPRLGRVTVYDRSWYGRVLVERVEGFCAPEDWQRAFSEINAFEDQLAEFGIIVLKFWLAIGAEEQLRRFKDRELTPYKQYKITEEDWRNREKWDAYEAAACEMIERTSTERAPWILVEAEDKHWARIKVMRVVAERLEKELGEVE